MKTIKLTVLLLCCAYASFAQSTTQDITRIDTEIKRLQNQIDSLSKDRDYAELKNDILENKDKIISVKESLHEDNLFEGWTIIDMLAKIFAPIVIVAAGLLGYRKFTNDYIGQIKDEVKAKVPAEVAKATSSNLETLKKEYSEYQKHNDLREKSKVIVINKKDTEFPDGFLKVMNLFGVDLSSSESKIEIDDISEANDPKYYDKLKAADLVVIENQVPQFQWEVSLPNTPYEKLPAEIRRNVDEYVKLSNEIGGSTALLYYGSGKFPVSRVETENQLYISFTNAPSQLYQNMMNMLKFKNEVENPSV